MEEAHYDIPWEFVHRRGVVLRNVRSRSACEDPFRLKEEEQLPSGSKITELPQPVILQPEKFRLSKAKHYNHAKPDKVTPVSRPERRLLHSSAESDRNRMRVNSERCSNVCGIPLGREKFSERDFIHCGVDRVLAESRLMRCDVGTFLVRLRQNNSLALSIRSNNRVLHIKLELHNNQWILGEGPAFGSIASVIKFYRTHELPIRGADHVVLTTPVLATNSF